jgi:hypothetical protein
MSIADGSQARLADVPEVTIGTIPTSPAFQTMRYVSANIRLTKQVDISPEIRADRNVPGITDIGRAVQGDISTRLSYGTFDVWLSRVLAGAWATNVLKNGVAHSAGTLEFTYEQGATDSYIRYRGCRINSLDLQITARQAITASWGFMGIGSPTPTTAILSGATYAAPTTTEDFNAGLNVANLSLTSATMVSSPKVQSLNLRIVNNIYANDVVGAYDVDSHGFGRFEVTGTARIYFESLAVYTAIMAHEDVAISFDLTDAAGNSYEVEIPKVKFLDGGPPVPGNGQAVIIECPFQGFYDSSSGATITITRIPA